jgi:TIR domain
VCHGARQPHCEYRAFARFARHRHVAAHHACELARDGEAEPGAAEALSGRGFEEPKKNDGNCTGISRAATSGQVDADDGAPVRSCEARQHLRGGAPRGGAIDLAAFTVGCGLAIHLHFAKNAQFYKTTALHEMVRQRISGGWPGARRKIDLPTPTGALRYRVPAGFLVFYVKQTISVHSSMSSLADAPDLVGFFIYSREDDEDSGGKLSKLRDRIQAELRGQLGRTKRDFRLWQDKTAIAHGKLWEDEIKSAIAESVFFIPIITPTAVRSHHCKFEFDSFLAREKELGRSDLVFPILYIPVPALTGDRWRQDPLLSIIGSRQYEQWQNLRQLDPSSTEVALRVEKFCANICGALQQDWLSPEERQQAEARRVAEGRTPTTTRSRNQTACR